jgi:hypothetical protein
MSAAEQQLEGWPLPATLVDRTLYMRKWVAAFRRAENCSCVKVAPGMCSPCCGIAMKRTIRGMDGA